MYNISRNKSITQEFIENHLDWRWDIQYLSNNTMNNQEMMMFKPAK